MKNVSKYKIIISILFGILGFAANFYSLEIINLSKVGLRVNILWGLIFPLLITLTWGFKYGLISALAGGCQTMWLLWSGDGYGLLYSVPIFTLWVLWHGFWHDYRKNRQSWYANKYIIEIPFRVVVSVGMYTVFRYLISLNPPFWASDIETTFVPLSWINSVVIKLIFVAYLLLVITDVLLNLPPVRKFFHLKKQSQSQNKSLVFYSFLLLGIIFWIVDSIVDYFFFYDKTIFELLLFDIPGHELFVRLIVLVLCMISGLIINSVISKKELTEKKYRKLFQNLEDAVFVVKADENSLDNKIIEVNKQTVKMLQYTKNELLSMSLKDITDIERQRGGISPQIYNNSTNIYEKEFVTNHNNKIPVEIKSNTYKMGNEEVELIIARDISKRKEYESQLNDQKEELQASNQQLEAYNQEIIAMNEELDESLVEVNKLNERFINMINVVSHLDEDIDDEAGFLSNLLHSAINIVPEADYGKIFLVDENNYCRFIDTIGHDIDILKNITVNKDILFHSDDQNIYTSDEYSIDINKIPSDKKEFFTRALKDISKSIYINITVNTKMVARISLDIAAGSNKKFSSTTKNILETFATLASAFFSFQRYNKLQDQFDRELITSIIQLLELYDTYTKGHSENVAEMAAEIAEKMNLSQREIKNAYWAGMVHDIGKLIVPLNILNKKGSLTDNEYELIKKHSTWSFKALNKSETLNHIARYVLYHHERWDGKGYPEGLECDEIPLISQILAVADAWDAMTSKRSYRDSLGESRALEEIKENEGTQFSPEVVEVFLANENIDNQAS